MVDNAETRNSTLNPYLEPINPYLEPIKSPTRNSPTERSLPLAPTPYEEIELNKYAETKGVSIDIKDKTDSGDDTVKYSHGRSQTLSHDSKHDSNDQTQGSQLKTATTTTPKPSAKVSRGQIICYVLTGAILAVILIIVGVIAYFFFTGATELGSTGTNATNVPGRDGFDGDTGVTGPMGDKGEQGPPGDSCSKNECLNNNGGCSQYCIDTYDSYFCACETGYDIDYSTEPTFVCPGGTTCKQEKIDLVFVIDSSGSIRDTNPSDGSYDNWTLMLVFVNDIIDRLTISSDDVRVGVVRFGNAGYNEINLNEFSDKTSLKIAVRSILFDFENTFTAAGIREMRDTQFASNYSGNRIDVPNVAIIITDGESTIETDKTIPEAEAAHAAGIQIFTVGVTNSINRDEIRDMSSPPRTENENWFLSDDFQSLGPIIDQILSPFCIRDENSSVICRQTALAGKQCFCVLDDCNIRPLNGTGCINTNECNTNNGGCMQACTDVNGDYECSCFSGFALSRDDHTCIYLGGL